MYIIVHGGRLDRRVDTRMRRQARLDGDRPLHLSAIVAEAALLHCAHERSIAREQFRPDRFLAT